MTCPEGPLSALSKDATDPSRAATISHDSVLKMLARVRNPVVSVYSLTLKEWVVIGKNVRGER